MQLRHSPEVINQCAFGVCGMTSVVYVLLRRKPEIVDNLFSAIFVDIAGKGKFRTATKGNHLIDLTSLVRRYFHKDLQLAKEAQKLRAEARALPPASRQALRKGRSAQAKDDLRQQTMPQYMVDYLLSRALGYLLKKTDARRYNSEKADFNVKFDRPVGGQAPDYRHVTRAGTLALRTRNVAYILKEILGAQNVHITKNASRPVPAHPLARADAVAGVHEDTFNTAAGLNQKFGFRFPSGDRTRIAIAAIFSDLLPGPRRATGANRKYDLQDNIQVPGQPVGRTLNQVMVLRGAHNPISAQSGRDNRDAAAMEYNHWVVIEGFNLTPHVAQFLIWTWGKYYRVDVQPQYLLSYIQDVIFGQFQ